MQTIKERQSSLLEVSKSKFIALAIPLKEEEEFKPILLSLRKEHPKAKHIVYAYRVGNKAKSTDDREPKGTAGHPLLELLYKRDINYCAIIVVRYFGGSLLGAGRLLRTYLQSGIDVLNKCEFINI